MAGQTDLYFPEDIEADASHIRGARYVVIPSLWGHMAGSGLNDPDTQFIDTQLKALLAW
jgi:homoserine O-acetyltransferase